MAFHMGFDKIRFMRLLKDLGTALFWMTLWIAIPATMLYPLALWMVNHTRFSAYRAGQSYVIAIALLFLPTGFLVDYLYRSLIRDRHKKNKRPTKSQNDPQVPD